MLTNNIPSVPPGKTEQSRGECGPIASPVENKRVDPKDQCPCYNYVERIILDFLWSGCKVWLFISALGMSVRKQVGSFTPNLLHHVSWSVVKREIWYSRVYQNAGVGAHPQHALFWATSGTATNRTGQPACPGISWDRVNFQQKLGEDTARRAWRNCPGAIQIILMSCSVYKEGAGQGKASIA